MKKKILGSIALCGVLFSSSQAVSFEAFGHIGTAYSFGIDKISKENGEKEKPWFGGATARVGFEVGMGPVSLGLGVAGGLPYAISPNGEFSDFVKDVYFTRASDVKWYNWISDAYLRVDTRYFSFIGGRYDLSTFFDGKNGQIANGVDWFSGLSEGLSFRLESRYVNWWGIYSYETMDFGARNPGRIGNDLMGYHQYQKNGVDDAHYFSSGIDINIDDMVYIDPFSTYLLQGGDDILQAGGKLEFVFGGKSILSDTVAVIGLELNRRLVGMANVKDITTIKDEDKRAKAERYLILAAKEYIKKRDSFNSGKEILDTLKEKEGRV